MAQPQAGILPEPNPFAVFLIFQVRDAGINAPRVASIVSNISALTYKAHRVDPKANLVCTVALGSEFWDLISPQRRPAGLRPFKPFAVDGRLAPNTGGDLLFHIISKRHDLNFDLALKIRHAFNDLVEVKDEIHGFRYLDKRDLSGFIDGTENPKGKERAKVALVGPEDPQFEGGSYVYTQRYIHDLNRWVAVPLHEQEKIIGRRKSNSEELSGRIKPPTAHISRVVIEENGAELKIVRHSFPYGTTTEAGLFFIAYTKSLDITDKMLARMIGASGDGAHDHLLQYTRAVSGATFFAPPLRLLQSLASKSSPKKA